MVVSVSVGAAGIPLDELLSLIGRRMGVAGGPANATREAIIFELRLPRVITSAVVGAGLAMSGAVMQAATRNPLADPYLLGLSSGAGLGAVLVLVMGLDFLLPVAAFVGALGALATTLLLARSFGGASSVQTVLAGVAVSAFATAIMSFVIFWGVEGDTYREVLSWLLGSLGAAGWRDVWIVLGATALGGSAILAFARHLDAFLLGDDAAVALGIDVRRTRRLLFILVALVTGAMVSVSGAIGFVGLVIPHAARLLFGAAHRRLLPFAALFGSIVLVWTDMTARTVFAPRELPVGVMTAFLGAPAFAAILYWRRQSR